MRLLIIGLGIVGASLFAFIIGFFLYAIAVPQSIWAHIFPNEYYDNVEVKLGIDGELVTVSGTAFCSIQEVDKPLGGGPNEVTRTGGAAVTIMLDGRAVVIPYSRYDYCREPLSIDSDLGISNWRETFDQRLSLEGKIDILILDDGDNPTRAEVILGPRYFENANASIKLISAERWRSKSGEVTISSLGWFRANDLAPQLPPGVLSSSDYPSLVSRTWVGAYVTILPAEQYEIDPEFFWLVNYLSYYGGLEDPPQVPEGDWTRMIMEHPYADTQPVQLSGHFVTLGDPQEPYRIPLEPRQTEAGAWYPDRQTVSRIGNCYGGRHSGRGRWDVGREKVFLHGDDPDNRRTAARIVPLPMRSYKDWTVFFDTETRALIYGWSVCIKPGWALPLEP